jgi:predicted alpha/beta superfamily hydrolase
VRAAAVLAMLAVSASVARSETVTVPFLVQAPPTTPAGAAVWLSGSVPALGTWNGAGVPCRARPDGLFTAEVALERGATVEFKVTRGSWDTVEKGPAGEELANRVLTVRGPDTVRVAVAAWRDQVEGTPRREHTLTGDVRQHPPIASRFVRDRAVRVWLPPDYERDRDRRYPVVYFHDGNNVLDAATAFIGVEWGADETADRLIRAGRVPPFIIVAVDNTPDRMAEYTWVPDPRFGGGGRAAEYARYLVEELKPSIDSTYRTRPEAGHTVVVGSSLGGIVSLWLGLRHPEVFGRVGCVSPAAWWARRDIVRGAAMAARAPERVWIDIGTEEGTARAGAREWLEDARALRDALAARPDAAAMTLHHEEVEGARHDERAWAARLDRILEFLLADLPR